MVFDVARAVDVLGIGRIALELGEDRGKRFADKICEHVEAAAVRHPDHEFTNTEFVAAVQDCFERRHQRLGALDAEPFGASVAPVEKPFEGLRLGQCPQDLFSYSGREDRAALTILELFLDPRPLGRCLNVHVLDADPAAIRLAQNRDDLAQAGALAAGQIGYKDLAVEVRLTKAVTAKVEFRIGTPLFQPERVEIGFEMAAHPVGADQLQRADRVVGSPAQRRFINSRSRCRPIADDRRFTLGPRRSAHLGEHRRNIIVHFREEPTPALVNAAGVFEKPCIELRNESGIRAGQKCRPVYISHNPDLNVTPAKAGVHGHWHLPQAGPRFRGG